jgi:hypothetical protein
VDETNIVTVQDAMNLHLSTTSILNTVYATEEGHSLYKVETPMKLTVRISTVSKIVPNGDGDLDGRERFAPFASIHWRKVGARSTSIKIHEREIDTGKFFRK